MRKGLRALGMLAFLGLFICGPAQAVTINFDDVVAPSLFANALALKNEYASQGVFFDGPQARYGGAILNQGGNFGVNALSG